MTRHGRRISVERIEEAYEHYDERRASLITWLVTVRKKFRNVRFKDSTRSTHNLKPAEWSGGVEQRRNWSRNG